MHKIQKSISHLLVAAILSATCIPANAYAYQEQILEFRDKVQLEVSHNEAIELKLSEILAKAIENNINLNIAKANTKEAKWKHWEKIAEALPDIQLNATSRNRDGTFFLNTNFQTELDERTSSAGIRFNYRLFNGGSTAFLAWAEKFYRKAVADKELSQYNLVLYDSVDLFYQLIKNQEALKSKSKALEHAKTNLDLAEKFLKAGTGTKYDVIQAEAKLARSEQQLIDQEAHFRVAGINLANHLNTPLSTPYKAEGDKITKLQLIDENIDIKEFISTAFNRNPDIKSSLKARQGAIKEGLAKVGDFLPKVDVYADFTGTGEQFDNLFGMTTLGLQANYNIGDGLGLNAISNIKQSQARVRKAKLEYQKELLRIEKALRLAYLEFQKSKSIVSAAEKELEASQETLRLAKLRYENGLEVFATLIKKEAELTEAELNLTNSIADYNLAQAKLAYNMGTISIKDLIGHDIDTISLSK